VTPKKGLATLPTGFYFISPIDLRAETGSSAKFVPIDGHILDVAMNPTRTEHPYLIEGRSAVYLFDEVTGRSRPFADVVDPLRVVLGGPKLNLYVLCRGHLDCIGMDGRRIQKALEQPIDAIAYDDMHKMLLAYSLTTRKLYRYQGETLNLVDALDIPPGPCRPGDTLHMSFSPGAAWGTLFLHGDGHPALTRVFIGEMGATTEQISLPAVQHPTGFYADERGMIFVTDNNLIRSFDRNGVPTESKFRGKPGGYQFQVLRPYSNFDTKTHAGPSYWNVLPEFAPR